MTLCGYLLFVHREVLAVRRRMHIACVRVCVCFLKFFMCHFVFFRFFGAGGGLKAILTSGPLDKLIGMTTHHPGHIHEADAAASSSLTPPHTHTHTTEP